MYLSIVVPMRNEEENVARMVGELDEVAHLLPRHEIICVDDGSSDGTSTALLAAVARRDTSKAPLRLRRHRVGVGQSAALRTGILAARGEWIATLDGDCQNEPADIRRLLDALGPNPAVRALIAGERSQRHDSWVRRWSSRVANAVRRAILHDGSRDTGCALKLFPREVFLELPFFDHVHHFLPAVFRAAGARVVTVPVSHRPRHAGTSKYGIGNRLWVGLLDLAGVWWLQRRLVRPELIAAHEEAFAVESGEPYGAPVISR